MPLPTNSRYSFGPFSFDFDRGLLEREGEPVPLTPKRLLILRMLIENAGQLVQKEDIFSRVWPDQEVEENNLTFQIFNIRRALGDDPKDPRYILTVPGAGYLFKGTETLGGLTTMADVPDEVGGVAQLTKESDRQPKWWWAVIVVLSIGVGLPVGYYLEGGSPGASFKSTLITSLSGLETEPAFSPDGQSIAFTSEGETGDNRDIYVTQLAENRVIRLTRHPGTDEQAAWSPDGRRLAFLRRSEQWGEIFQLMVFDQVPGPERELGQVRGGLDWSPDGAHLAVTDVTGPDFQTGIVLIALNNLERRWLTIAKRGELTRDERPRFSPDGSRIAFIRQWSNDTAIADLFVLTIRSGEIRQVTFDQKRISALRWDGDDLLFCSTRDGERQLWRVDARGGPVRLVAGDLRGIETFTLSGDGQRLAFTKSDYDTSIEVRDLSVQDRQPVCTINTSQSDDSPRFSPDGRQLAFVSSRDDFSEIWVSNPDCTGQRPITALRNRGVGSPRWSPDGAAIAFDWRPGATVEIGIASLASGLVTAENELRRLRDPVFSFFMPAWSDDGRWLYFESDRPGGTQVWRAEIAGGLSGKRAQVTLKGGEPVEAEGGRTVYFINRERLWRKELDSGDEAPVPELRDIPIGRYWHIGRQAIWFIPQTEGVAAIVHRLDLTTRRIDQVFTLNGHLARWVPGITLTPDERMIAVSYVSYRIGDITMIEGWR